MEKVKIIYDDLHYIYKESEQFKKNSKNLRNSIAIYIIQIENTLIARVFRQKLSNKEAKNFNGILIGYTDEKPFMNLEKFFLSNNKEFRHNFLLYTCESNKEAKRLKKKILKAISMYKI